MRRVRQKGPTAFVAGLVVLIVISLATYLAFTKENPFASHFEVRAAFKTVNDLKANSPVRIGGVKIGKVTKVEPVGEGQPGAVVTFQIDDRSVPIRRDAQIKVRPRIFLEGNYFVDVKPGSPSAPELKEGEMIPIQQTAAPVQFGQLLSALQSDTREDLKKVLQEYGEGVSGEGGAGYNRSIPYQLPAFKNSAIANTATLGLLEHDLSGYIDGAGAVAAALDRDGEALKSLITDFATTAGALAEQEQNLSAAIHQLPITLKIGRRALGALNLAFPPLRRLIVDFRPAVRSSGPALDASIPFAREARGLMQRSELRGLVADLRPTVPPLVELNEGGVELQNQVRLLSSCQNRVILPNSDATVGDPNFKSSGPVYQEAVKWLPGIAGESRGFDANGQYIRTLGAGANFVYPTSDGRFFFTQAPIQGVNPPKNAAPALSPRVPCETQQPPDLRSTPSAPPQSRTVRREGPAYTARYDAAKLRAVDWLRDELERTGLDSQFRVIAEELTEAGISALPKAVSGP